MKAQLTKWWGWGGLDASSILQMEGVNLSLMESKEAEGMAGTGQ